MRMAVKSSRGARNLFVWSLLLASVSGGCLPVQQPSVEQERDGIAPLLGPPTLWASAASFYRRATGEWPGSVAELEGFYEGPAFGIDWRRYEGALAFEELPDGTLRITSLDTSYDFTVTVEIPPEQSDD